MRKEAGFEVTDRITLSLANNDNITDIVNKNEEKIKAAVLADSIVIGEASGFTKEWNINGETVVIGVSK